jgi:hypothetical protein
MATILNKRGTRANLNALAASNGLNAGEIYLITDENRIAIGLSVNTYEVYAKTSEAGGASTTVTLPQQSSVTPPATGNAVLYSKEEAPENLSLNYMMPNGSINQIQKFLCSGVSAFLPNGYGATTATVVGGAAMSTLSLTAANYSSGGGLLGKSKRARVTSNTAAGSANGVYISNTTNGWRFLIGNLSDSIFKIRFGITDAAAVAGARFFAGLSNTISIVANVDPSTETNQVGLAVLDTDNTQFYIVYGGLGGAQTPIPLGSAIGSPTNTSILWDFEIFSKKDDKTSFSYKLTNKNTGVSVSGTVTGTATTQITSSLLVPRTWRSNNTTALAVSYDVCYIYMESGQLA